MAHTLFIKIDFSEISSGIQNLGVLNWDSSLEMKPLQITIDDIEVDYFIKNEGIGPKDGILLFPEQYVVMKIKSDNIIYNTIKKLKSLDKDGALKLYNYFSNSIKKVAFYFHKLKVSPYIEYRIGTFENFIEKQSFLRDDFKLSYSFDNKNYGKLEILQANNGKIAKKTHSKNSIFYKEYLLDSRKWYLMCKEKDFNLEREEFILELLDNRSKIHLGYGRFKILEISILFEIYLTEIVVDYLKTQGFSSTKLDSIEKNFNFYSVINIYLPLILGKVEYVKFKNDLENLDKLRLIRNHIVHKNKKEFNRNDILLGVESGITICKYFHYKKN